MAHKHESLLDDMETYSGVEVSELLGAGEAGTHFSAEELHYEGKIFAVKPHHEWRYPVFQFEDGKVRSIIAKILKIIPQDPMGWNVLHFFATPNSVMGGERPMDELDNDEEVLLLAATRYREEA